MTPTPLPPSVPPPVLPPAAAPDILVLHGANGCRAEMQPWCEALATQGFRAHAINLAGHGGMAIPDQLSMPVFTHEVLAQLDALGLKQPVIVLGYSFGGLVALHLARHHPERVRAVVSLATKHVFDAKAVQYFTHLLQVPRLMAMPHRRDHLSRVHLPNDWRRLVEALHSLFAGFGEAPPLTQADLAAILCPALVLSGSQDQVVSADETVALGQGLPQAEVAMFQGKAHPSEAVPALGLAKAVRIWCESKGLMGALSSLS